MDKSSINRGLLQYTFDWMQKLGEEISFYDALIETSKRWQDFSPEVRAKYEAIEVSSFTMVEYKGNESLESNMRDEISIHLRTTVKSNEIQCASFFFISYNYFCKSDPENKHMPAEVSVCAYSMKKGLIKIYTQHMNPQSNLFGSYNIAQDHSKFTHLMPLPPNGLGTKNLRQVYMNIIRFLKEYNHPTYRDSSALPPLYTRLDNISVVESCCKYLHNLVPQQPEMVIYAIEYLGDELITRSLNQTDQLYNSFEIEFEKDKFEYEDGLACSFHEDRDRSKYCTQNQVVRWSYTLSNYLAVVFNFTKYPTYHCPPIGGDNYIEDPANNQSTNIYINDKKSSNDADCDRSNKYDRPNYM